jgi:hypothetical protein
MGVVFMPVAPGGVALPDLDQRVRHRTRVLVEHLSGDYDALAQRFAFVLAREVAVFRTHRVVAEQRPGDFRQRVRQQDQRLRWRALARGRIRRIEVFGLREPVTGDIGHAIAPRSGSGTGSGSCTINAGGRPV